MGDERDGPRRTGPTGISVVLPAFNEDANVAHVVHRALDVLSRQSSLTHEIIVVDDGSDDATAHVVRSFVDRHYPRVRLVRHTTNQGYGAAIRTGVSHATNDLVFYTDADNQFDIAELPEFMALIDQYDVVVGYRMRRYDPLLRLVVSWVYNRIVRVVFRVAVRDIDCAFKLFRREVLDQIDIECSDFFVDTELLVRAKRANFRIAERGVQHYPRVAGQTTVFPSDVPRTLRTLVRMFFRTHSSRSAVPVARAAPRHGNDTVEVLPGAVAS